MSGSSVLAGLSLDNTLSNLSNLLESILSRLGFADPVNGSHRVTLAGTNNIGTVTTVTTVTTLSTLTNQTSIGGINAAYDQYAAFGAGASMIRAQIIVS